MLRLYVGWQLQLVRLRPQFRPASPLLSTLEDKSLRSTWWVQLLALLALPFILVPAMYVIALLVPGTFKVDSWRMASSLIFLAAAGLAIILLVRSKTHWVVRSGLALFSLAVLLVAAFIMQVRSNCGDEAVFIGAKPSLEAVTECE